MKVLSLCEIDFRKVMRVLGVGDDDFPDDVRALGSGDIDFRKVIGALGFGDDDSFNKSELATKVRHTPACSKAKGARVLHRPALAEGGCAEVSRTRLRTRVPCTLWFGDTT